MDLKEATNRISAQAELVSLIRDEVSKVIVGQEKLIDRLILALVTGGHILLEGVPGLAKTLSVNTLAKALGLGFKRISFTPDLLPADVVGTLIYSPKTGEFTPKKGPVFTNLLLADEINRAPAKVQSALLESMQERQVTIGEETYRLPEPFLVLATQNPIEQEGTYQLPEAQVDRFMLKAVIGYPTIEEERMVVDNHIKGKSQEVQPMIGVKDIVEAREVVKQIYVSEEIEKYITDIVFATRYPDRYNLGGMKQNISFGGSPRASINLALAARAYAFLKHRGYVIPDDVRAMAHDVLRHRIGLTYEAEANNITADDIVNQILENVKIS